MTVQQFLKLTSSTPPPALRQAMAAALAVEPADRHEAFPRFYGRVLDELGLAGQTDILGCRGESETTTINT